MDEVEREEADRPVYIDAEDADRSTWCRYINSASSHSHECNLCLRTDGYLCRAFLEATRDIEVGEELCFDYGPGHADHL